ncbi:MAG: TRAP transporter small permease, partial [Bauldia litoralis]
NDLAALAATVYAANASWLYVERIARLDTRSMALGLPMTIPHSAVLAGFVGMALVAAILLVRDAHAFAVNAQASGAAS